MRIGLPSIIAIFLLLFAGSAHAEVAISEVMWMGSDLSTADEWIELVSPSEDTDLSGWTITSQKGNNEETMLTFATGTVLSAGEYFLVSNYAEEQSRISVVSDLVTSAVSLPNSKLLLRLRDREGVIIDEVDDGVGAPFAGSNVSGEPKASMERIDFSIAGVVKENWKTAESSRGFDEGELIFGTPGFANGSVEEIEEPPSSAPDGATDGKEEEETEETEEPEEEEEPAEEDPELPVGVLITEILANPIGSDDHEWIEIANDSSEPVALSGFSLRKGSSMYALPDESLAASEYRSFRKSVSGISLSNQGALIELLFNDIVIDSLEYPETAEEVSFGRNDDREALMPFCVPTEGAANTGEELDPQIIIQSGETEGIGHVSLNLTTDVEEGSLSSAECLWDFDDGSSSDSCNPPSHSYDEAGEYEITLTVDTFCGEQIEKSLEVTVEPSSAPDGATDGKEEEESEEEEEDSEETEEPEVPEEEEEIPSCVPTLSHGVVISEVFPSPFPGEEEWLELRNLTDFVFQLCGWILDDVLGGGSAPWTFPEISIPPHGVIILQGDTLGVKLNDSGDEVRLLSPDGSKDVVVAYPKMRKGESYVWLRGPVIPTEAARLLKRLRSQGFSGDGCASSTATPGEDNICDEDLSVVTPQVELPKPPVARPVSSKKQASVLPLRVQYTNVIAEEKTDTGATMQALPEEFAKLKRFESIERPAMKKKEVSFFSDAALIAGGMFSSAALFAIRALLGR